MANPKNKGMTVREAAEEFCTHWAWAMAVSGDPGDAASELTKMLGHKVDPPDSRRARWRARENTPQPAGNDEIRAVAVKVMRKAEKKGVLDRGVQRDRETAVFMAIKNIPSDPDQFDGPAPRRLWATGRRVPVDPSKPRELIPTDMWEFLTLDIKGNRAFGEGLEYCDLRFYDTEPQAEIAQAPAGRTQDDAVLALEMVSARGTEVKPATPAVLPEPAVIAGGASSVGRPTLKDGIEVAYQELRDAGDINFDAPMNTLYEPIREKVREYKGDLSLQRGLGKEAIRKVISPLFEADKNNRSASP